MTLRCWVEAIGVRGPGLAHWPATRAILTGAGGYSPARTQIPQPALLSAAERRRAGRALRLAIDVAAEAAGPAASRLPAVFASSGSDGDNCHELCNELATSQRAVSPTRFMNSVHNAAAGYWSLAVKAMAPSVALCAHDGSFAAGLLECLAQLAAGEAAVLLVAYDTDYPEPLRATRPIPDAFGCALRLTAGRTASSLAALDVDLGSEAPTRLDDAALEAMRASIPAARALPLLLCLARGAAATCAIDYLDDLRLAVAVVPC